MNVMLTGRSGFVGKQVDYWLGVLCHRVSESLEDNPDAIIHLAWAGLPNYESEAHYDNIPWQVALVKEALRMGVKNITIAGTCLESLLNPPHYALAKRMLCEQVLALDPTIKWLRMPWLFGTGQREDSLLPSLKRAIARGDKTFSVAPTSKVFVDVRMAAHYLCGVMDWKKRGGIIEWPSAKLVSVADWCRQNMAPNAIELVEDYPLKPYEK